MYVLTYERSGRVDQESRVELWYSCKSLLVLEDWMYTGTTLLFETCAFFAGALNWLDSQYAYNFIDHIDFCTIMRLDNFYRLLSFHTFKSLGACCKQARSKHKRQVTCLLQEKRKARSRAVELLKNSQWTPIHEHSYTTRRQSHVNFYHEPLSILCSWPHIQPSQYTPLQSQ